MPEPAATRSAADVERDVLSCLDAIQDPCSCAMGAPAGLVTFGLVKHIAVDERPGGAHVDLTLAITEPGCLMGAVFLTTAEREVSALPSVASVDVRIDRSAVWTEEDMTPGYRLRLAEVRAQRIARLSKARATDAPQNAA